MFHDIYLLIVLQKIAVGMFLHAKTQVKTRRQAENSGFILFFPNTLTSPLAFQVTLR